MVLVGSLQFSHELGLCRSPERHKQFKTAVGRETLLLLRTSNLSQLPFQGQNFLGARSSDKVYMPICSPPYRYNVFKCQSSLVPGQPFEISSMMKTAATLLQRSYGVLQGSPPVAKLVSAIGIILFAVWGIGPLLRQIRTLFLHRGENSWKKSGTYYVMSSYLQPLLLWVGATLICRALDPVVLPTAASQVVKQRLLNFVRSLSTVLAFAYCLSSVIQQAQKFFMETNESSDTRNMGFQFAGKAVYSAVWVAAVSLFMELLGFSTQKWLTAGGLGTVLLTLAGREIFTNFLSSAMIHATRPFVVNEWIQTKIEGYEVSGTVEHVGWWSPTIVRGEDREAVHIPNHKFTMNVVRNLSQKTHWRIKTHLAISHLDVNKINNIVADMRKVLAKNPQVEHKRLHRRVFLENINPESQALLILISCFVKTSHFEEYLCVKEAILLDLLRVISHHRARLATPIRTVQKLYSEAELESVPFADSIFSRGGVTNRPLLMIEPSYKITGEDKTRTPSRSVRTSEQDSKSTARPATETKTDGKVTSTSVSDTKVNESPNSTSKENAKAGVPNGSDVTLSDEVKVRTSKQVAKSDSSSLTKNTNQPKTVDFGKNRQNTKSENPSLSPPDTTGGGGKAGENSATSQVKSEGEKATVAKPTSPSRPALEENIVLGVALEGSKRTLPIDEEMASSPTHAEAKELAAHRNGSGPPAPEKDKKKDDQVLPTAATGD